MRVCGISVLRGKASGGGGEVLLPDERVRSDRIADDGVVKSIAPVYVHAQQGETNRAAEVTCHVVEARCIACFFPGDRGHRSLVEWHHGEHLAYATQNLRRIEVVADTLRGEADVEHATHGKGKPTRSHQ